MRASRFSGLLVLAIFTLCVALSTPQAVQADHCFGVCTSLGWSDYAYGNFSKRTSPYLVGTSDCNCMDQTTYSGKTGKASHHHHHEAAAKGAPTPNDHCFAACCGPTLKPTPSFNISYYGYGDLEVVKNPMGDCLCVNSANMACARQH